MKPSEALLKYGCDKVLGWPFGHSYAQFYDELFAELKHPLNILEIGVFKGQSLMAWRTSFPDAKITGIDIYKYEYVLEIEDINFVHEDIKNVTSREKFDVIIDDSSHDLQESTYIVKNFCQNLTEQGVMVIEDVQIPELYIQELLKVLPDGFAIDSYDFRYLTQGRKHDDFIFKIKRL